MNTLNGLKEEYRGWGIEVQPNDQFCANYSFRVTAPDGRDHWVKMGGESLERAFDRAREWIDMELAMQEDE